MMPLYFCGYKVILRVKEPPARLLRRAGLELMTPYLSPMHDESYWDPFYMYKTQFVLVLVLVSLWSVRYARRPTHSITM